MSSSHDRLVRFLCLQQELFGLLVTTLVHRLQRDRTEASSRLLCSLVYVKILIWHANLNSNEHGRSNVRPYLLLPKSPRAWRLTLAYTFKREKSHRKLSDGVQREQLQGTVPEFSRT